MTQTWRRSLAVVLGLVLLTALSVSAQRTVVGKLTWTAGAVTPTTTSEPAGSLYTRTDTAQIYVYDGSAWRTLDVLGVASGYKLARGVVAVTNAHSGIETVVTGLATVVACQATMADDPTTTAESVTCSIGDQAGSPAAGSIYVKGWKTLGATPAASTTTSVNTNWSATGT